MCYTIDKGVICDCRNLPNMGITSQEAANLIIGLEFDILISGGIDMDMADALCDAGVEVVAGVQGSAREVVEAYVSQTLIGGVTLCHVHGGHGEEDEEGEEDIDSAFDAIAERLVARI